jgi:hypothetical protein
MSPAEWIGSLGVALLLVAFALQLAGVLGRASGLYSALNALGAGLACWASWQIGFLLEGLWCLVALAALLRGR